MDIFFLELPHVGPEATSRIHISLSVAHHAVGILNQFKIPLSGLCNSSTVIDLK